MSELKVDKSKVLKTQLVKPHKFAPKRQGDIVWETKVHVPELGKDVSLFRYGPNKVRLPCQFSPESSPKCLHLTGHPSEQLFVSRIRP